MSSLAARQVALVVANDNATGASKPKGLSKMMRLHREWRFYREVFQRIEATRIALHMTVPEMAALMGLSSAPIARGGPGGGVLGALTTCPACPCYTVRYKQRNLVERMFGRLKSLPSRRRGTGGASPCAMTDAPIPS